MSPRALQQRWEGICDALEDEAFELTAEEFAPILATFKAMQARGVQFDRGMCALMLLLERQALQTDEDGDADDADRMLNHEAETFPQPA